MDGNRLGTGLPKAAANARRSLGERRLGHVSHDLRQFLVRRPLAGFDELDDEGVYVHHGLL